MGRNFLKINRGVIVNMDHIERMGTDCCILRTGGQLFLAAREQSAIRAAYGDYLLDRHSHRPGEVGVEPMDMTVLLGNCLENALEALRRLPEGQRRLSVELMPANAMLLLRIQNTCGLTHGSGKPSGWEDFVSGKGAGHQGVGLRSVAAIAEKYDGSAQFQCKDGLFTTRVILNPSDWKPQGDAGAPGNDPGAP